MKDRKKKPKQAGLITMIDDVLGQLGSIADNKHASRKNELWEAYTKLEHAILLLKLGHDFETPGGFEFTKFDRKSGKKELLEFAVAHLQDAKSRFSRGRSTGVQGTVANLRKSRDALKLILLKQ